MHSKTVCVNFKDGARRRSRKSRPSKTQWKRNDLGWLERRYVGFEEAPASVGWRTLQIVPEAKLTEGVSIDDYSTWRAVRFADRDEGV